MYLVLRKNQEILLSIDLNEYTYDNLIFGQDTVKELLFIKTIYTNDDFNVLKPLYELLNQYYEEADETILIYNENLYNIIHFPIKAVLHRNMHYVRERKMEVQDYLSIRFTEDNEIKYNKKTEKFECSHRCEYNQVFKCSKYQTDIINNEICEQCYLEMQPVLYKFV